ncbi:DNA mismatch repair endonuclease MutL [Treponema parvum]|uniref:DNA mismatch repair protein MutL n=1 Tax=Treponema parvum TaxID=138851 RepID=A0A975F032_9SPIR|nr:DNA mismatch repair endonuclease MutL [Treponema parvum]QTQ11957.1 DNA mismatch repair endonuclease MutL [Treponema parvum]QTQ16065.1 DNA mismatch repair endonuclease MutL [Treponema parvum]
MSEKEDKSLQTAKRRPIRVLNAEVARKIAAGEVIDRPNAIVRELMDNAVDSGANSITVELSGGGIDKIRVIDDGSGITREDLLHCARPHATSKIQTETDLLHLSTLGFRGEALASIAAVSRLSIMSGKSRLRASVTEDHIIEDIQPVSGTIVQSEALFENFPARRVFLKRPASETTMCKNTFIEKSLPKPEIAFRLTVDGQTKLDLPSGQSLTERFIQANSIRENEKLFYEIQGSGSDFTFKLIIGEPSVSRPDKKFIFIYVNGRKISEFSLVQAIEYGCQGYFPNGTHPAASLFVQIAPESVDFNIHPAKKEARFRDISELHHAVSSCVKNFFRQYTLKAVTSASEPIQKELSEEFSEKFSAAKDIRSRFFSPSYASSRATKEHPFEKTPDFYSVDEALLDDLKTQAGLSDTKNTETGEPRYRISNQSPKQLALAAIAAADGGAAGDDRFSENTDGADSAVNGTNDGTAGDGSSNSSYSSGGLQSGHGSRSSDRELSDEPIGQFSGGLRYLGTALGVFLLAEKNDILYMIDQHAAHERILYDKIMASQGRSQALLVPYVVETQSVQEDAYMERIREKLNDAGFSAKNCGDGRWEISSVPERWRGTEEDLTRMLLEKRIDASELISKLAAMTACKAAVKDGYILDDSSAKALAVSALELKDPHCPHGRPVYAAITKAELFNLVKRT